MSADPDEIAELRELWAPRLPEALRKVGVIERAVEALAAGTLDAALRREAAGHAHQLAGAAGTFGYPRASEHASALELGLEDPAADPQALQDAAAGLRGALQDG